VTDRDSDRGREGDRERQRETEGVGRHVRTAPRNTTTRERESGWMRREETCIGDDEDRTTTEKEREIYIHIPVSTERQREIWWGRRGGGARPESETDAHTIKLDREQSMRRQTHTLRHTVHCTVQPATRDRNQRRTQKQQQQQRRRGRRGRLVDTNTSTTRYVACTNTYMCCMRTQEIHELRTSRGGG
jgi:hypothetical protein